MAKSPFLMIAMLLLSSLSQANTISLYSLKQSLNDFKKDKSLMTTGKRALNLLGIISPDSASAISGGCFFVEKEDSPEECESLYGRYLLELLENKKFTYENNLDAELFIEKIINTPQTAKLIRYHQALSLLKYGVNPVVNFDINLKPIASLVTGFDSEFWREGLESLPYFPSTSSNSSNSTLPRNLNPIAQVRYFAILQLANAAYFGQVYSDRANRFITLFERNHELATALYSLLPTSYILRFARVKDVWMLPFESIKELENLEGLGGLDHFKYLRKIVLNKYNNISSLPLENLIQLEDLNLNENSLDDLGKFENLTNLQELRLNRNNISDLTPLTGLNKLKVLHLNDNNISDLSPLSKLTNLESLHLSVNQITDLTPLAKLSKLKELHLDMNQIVDLSPLSSLRNLETLHLSNNHISDLTPLKRLKLLKDLTVFCNQIVTDYANWPSAKGTELPEQVFFGGYRLNEQLSEDDIASIKYDLLSGRYSEQLKSAAIQASKNQDPAFFQLLVDAGLDLEVGYTSWGQFYEAAACRDEASCNKIRKIIKDTYQEKLWNKRSPKERRDAFTSKFANYEKLRQADIEMEEIRHFLKDGMMLHLSIAPGFREHEKHVLSQDGMRSFVENDILRFVREPGTLTQAYAEENNLEYIPKLNVTTDTFETELMKREDMKVLIISGHSGFVEKNNQRKLVLGNLENPNDIDFQEIDLELFSHLPSSVELIVLSCCYPNQAAQELAKYINSNVPILHTDSENPTSSHDFDNLVEYMLGKRMKNIDIEMSNKAQRCRWGNDGSGCPCQKAGLSQLEFDGFYYSGASSFAPVKFTWGKRRDWRKN